jgi:hypothetical protein
VAVAPEAQLRERYASQVGALWSGLAGTLARLEALAAAPERLADEEGIEDLRRLQYRLHAAGEGAVGLSPPASAQSAHGELAAALADARDATGELADAVELDGPAAIQPRIYEWRGALFRVRLARMRLAAPAATVDSPAEPDEEPAPGLAAPAAALALSLGGTIAFLVGATVGPWSLWALGAVALCSSLFVYRP